MNFKWRFNARKDLIALEPTDPDVKVYSYGWIGPQTDYDGKTSGYRAWISTNLARDSMPCEEVEYVSLRKAMRALKETVTVLLIGRGYGV